MTNPKDSVAAKRKILIITDTRLSALGGSENHIRFLVSHMDPLEYVFYVAELQGADMLKVVSDVLPIEIEGVSLIKLNVKRIYGFGALKAWWYLSRFIHKKQIDVVFSFHEKADIINALLWCGKNKKIRKVSSRRDMGICPSPLLLWLRRYLGYKYDAITAPCQAILSQTEKADNISPHKMHVIRNSVDVEKFKPQSYSDHTDLLRNDLQTTRFIGVSVGNLKAVKGYSDLLDAFSEVVRVVPHAQLLIVGEDNGSELSIRQQINHLDLVASVNLYGKSTDLPTIFAGCDYMVCSSLSEGLSNALLEGIASGLPIIATDVGGNNEIVDDGQNGFLCQPKKPLDIAKKIIKLYEIINLDTFSAQSRQIAVKKFSPDQICLEYVDFLKRLG